MAGLTIAGALEMALRELSSDSARVDAEYLLSKAVNRSFTWLKTWPDTQLSEPQEREFRQDMARRKLGEPVAYITGEQGFWTLTLESNPSTLIPRAETELLVEAGLLHLQQTQVSNSKATTRPKVLDLGTGTGAVALAIAAERADADVLACDFNPQAVELARRNSVKNKLSNVEVRQSDWFSGVSEHRFNLILSNPPYVAAGDPHLDRDDLRFEPATALVAGGDGLDDIRKISAQAPQYLVSGGALMVEHGFQQGEAVRELFRVSGFSAVETRVDLAGLERITLGIC